MGTFDLRGRLRADDGFTLVELLITCVILGILVAGLSNLLTSSVRASADTGARLQGQQSIRVAFDRLEYEARCASTATILSSGAGVHLVSPGWCAHTSTDVTWCVSSGSLVRYVGTSCAGAAQPFVEDLTSATPFSCYVPVGPLPQLRVTLTVNPTGRSADATTASDWIAMRNANATTSTSSSCT
jgi:prepilin-type N-terminal cleavage/methylation domain-containing protein